MATYVVGRDQMSCDIVVPAKYSTVSRSHLRLTTVANDLFLVEDLGSSGGTRVFTGGEWKKITKQQIGLDEPIRLTDYETTVRALLNSATATKLFEGPLSGAIPVDRGIPSSKTSRPADAKDDSRYDVFVSYAQADREQVAKLVALLDKQGWNTFWDREINPGEQWANYIESALSNSKVAVVVWSAASTRSEWVKAEAMQARELGKLVPVRIDSTPIPLPFGLIQTSDLSGETALTDQTPNVRQFLKAVASHAKSKPSAPLGFHSAVSDAAGAGGVISKLDIRHILFELEGRLTRREFWIGFLITLIPCMIIGILTEGLMELKNSSVSPGEKAGAAAFLYFLITLFCNISLLGKRIHDFGRSAWWAAPVLFAWGVGMISAQQNSVEPDRELATGAGVFIVIATIGWVVIGVHRGDVESNKHGPARLPKK